MLAQECRNLHRCLSSSSPEVYAQTSRFIEGIREHSSETTAIVMETVRGILDQSSEPQFSEQNISPNLQAAGAFNNNNRNSSNQNNNQLHFNSLRFLKDCMNQMNDTFTYSIATSTILNSIVNIAKNEIIPNHAKQSVDAYSEFHHDLSILLARECLSIWAYWYPNTNNNNLLDEEEAENNPSAFLIALRELEQYGIRRSYIPDLDSQQHHEQQPLHRLYFFEYAETHRFIPQKAAHKIHAYAQTAIEDLNSLEESEYLNSNLEYFRNTFAEFIRFIHSDTYTVSKPKIYRSLTDAIQKISMPAKQIYLLLTDYIEQRISSSELKKKSQNILNQDPAAKNTMSRVNSYNEVEAIDWWSRFTLDFTTQCTHALQALNRDHSRIPANPNRGIPSEMNSHKQKGEMISGGLTGSQLISEQLNVFGSAFNNNNNSNNEQGFNFLEASKLDKLDNRITMLQTRNSVLETQVSSQANEIKRITAENKRLQALAESRQDEVDLLQGQRTYFSYSTDYQKLLCLHQKLEQDYNELLFKQSKFTSTEESLQAENASLAEEQKMLSEITSAQKKTIQDLQLQLVSLKEQLKEKEIAEEDFKRDCERKYALNQLLTVQALNKNPNRQHPSIFKSDNSVLGISSSARRLQQSIQPQLQQQQQFKAFSERDFLRGTLVQSSSNGQTTIDIIPRLSERPLISRNAMKTGCLWPSVTLYEDELVRMFVLKESTGNPRSLKLQVFNKTRINFKHFSLKYKVNSTLSITREANVFAANETLPGQSLFIENIEVELRAIPYELPVARLKYQANFTEKQVDIVLPMTINQMRRIPVTGNISSRSQAEGGGYYNQNSSGDEYDLNKVIEMWNDARNDQIYRLEMFMIDLDVLQNHSTLLSMFPQMKNIPAASCNFIQIFGVIELDVAGDQIHPIAIKFTLINATKLAIQAMPLLQQTDHKFDQASIVSFLLQTYKELFEK